MILCLLVKKRENLDEYSALKTFLILKCNFQKLGVRHSNIAVDRPWSEKGWEPLLSHMTALCKEHNDIFVIHWKFPICGWIKSELSNNIKLKPMIFAIKWQQRAKTKITVCSSYHKAWQMSWNKAHDFGQPEHFSCYLTQEKVLWVWSHDELWHLKILLKSNSKSIHNMFCATFGENFSFLNEFFKLLPQ